MTARGTVLYAVIGLLAGAAGWALFLRAAPVVQRAPATLSALSWNDAVVRAAPSVVSLYASSSSARRGSLRRLDTRQGSGVIVAGDGLIVTNRHLIEGAEVINVVLPDGRLLMGRSIGEDAETDLALVRVPVQDLPALALDAVAPPRVGDIVLAIGNPFDVGQTVTQGIVSATRRHVAGGSVWQDFVQIDAAINPGNSGGALIDTRGELVGVNTAVFLGADEPLGTSGGGGGGGGPGSMAGRRAVRGIGYAIPAHVLARVVPELLAHGHVTRGWLGVETDDPPVLPRVDGSHAATRGALVTGLAHGAPGHAAGLERGDIVVALDGRPIDSARALSLGVAALPPGREIELQLLRGSASLTLHVPLGEQPARRAPPSATPPDPADG